MISESTEVRFPNRRTVWKGRVSSGVDFTIADILQGGVSEVGITGRQIKMTVPLAEIARLGGIMD